MSVDDVDGKDEDDRENELLGLIIDCSDDDDDDEDMTVTSH